MIVLYKTQEYEKNIDDEPSLKRSIERKLFDLENRMVLSHEMKNPKCYDKGNGIWVYKFQGKGQNSRVILQELFTEEREQNQLIIIRDYISQKAYEPKWRTRVEPIVEKGEYLDYNPLPKNEKRKALDFFKKRLSPEKRIKNNLVL